MSSPSGFDDATLRRFADLMVGFGANVQPGQIVAIGGDVGKEEVVRALAESAYRHGAKFVDASYFDLHVKRARLRYAAEDTLEFVPSWYGERVLALGDQRCARIGLSGPIAPGPARRHRPRADRPRPAAVPARERQGRQRRDDELDHRPVPEPPVGDARASGPRARGARSRSSSASSCTSCASTRTTRSRCGPPAPTRSSTAATRLTERRFDALHFEGPGTDLRVGLLPSSRFRAARFQTVDGIVHMPNLPTEEVFSTPDPLRTEGVVRSTKPLVVGGSIIRGLEVEFQGGRATRIDAEENADVLRGYTSKDEGASRLGEVALVDREGRIGKLGTTFFDTLLDENAASHIALGSAYAECLEDEADHKRMNDSQIHIDFMIGADDVSVTGADRRPASACRSSSAATGSSRRRAPRAAATRSPRRRRAPA